MVTTDDGDEAPPRRGAHKLTREKVLDAARSLVDREGVAALSMRRVAAELGVEAMALYRYAPSKDALLDGMAETIFVELNQSLADESPEVAAARSWREELHRVVREKYRLAVAHPNVMPLAASRMSGVPLARRPLAYLQDQERTLELLYRGGLTTEQVVLAFRACNAWTLGYIMAELRAVVDNPEEPDPAFRLGLHLMPARVLPHLRADAPAITERGGPDVLVAGLDALLDQFMSADAASSPPAS